MATVTNLEIFAAADGNAAELNLNPAQPNTGPVQTLFVKVISGTWKFGVGAAPGVNAQEYTDADQVPPITVSTSKPLYAEAANAAEEIVVVW
jgi:hypothetical protein